MKLSMTTKLIFIAIFLAAIPLSAAKPSFLADYNTTTLKVHIEDRNIRVTRIEQKFDNPASAVPSSQSAAVSTGMISEAQLRSLRRLILANGFLRLKEAYGAPAKERFYPYSIEVLVDGRKKKVLYRSNPSFEKQPKPFAEIEKMLTELGKEARNPEPAATDSTGK